MLVLLCGTDVVYSIMQVEEYRTSVKNINNAEKMGVYMSFWLAIVIIVSVGSLTEIFRQYFKNKENVTDVSEKKLEELMKMIEKHESRLSNLETVILELDKGRKYDNL